MNELTYRELLLNPKWHYKRSLILRRDRLTCTACQNEKIILNSQAGTFIKALKPSQSIYLVNPNEYLLHNLYKVEFSSCEGTKRMGWISLDNSSFTKWRKIIIELFYAILPKDDYEYGQSGEDSYYITLIRNKETKEVYYARELHAHHSYYQETKLPWEYPDNSLTTFCWRCHKDFHSEYNVNWLDANGEIRGILTTCYRCAGAGYFPQYRHVENGICFECRGAKYKELM